MASADIDFVNGYFRSLFPNEDIREFVKMFLAYTVHNNAPNHYAMMLAGSEWGKTCLMQVHHHYINDYLHNTSVRGRQHPEEPHCLLEVPEPNYCEEIDAELEKLLTDCSQSNVIVTTNAVPMLTNVEKIPQIFLVDNDNSVKHNRNSNIYNLITDHMDAYHNVLESAYRNLQAYYSGDLRHAYPKVLRQQSNKWLSQSLMHLWKKLKFSQT